jgi:hypothetical protein
VQGLPPGWQGAARLPLLLLLGLLLLLWRFVQ